MRIIYVRPEKNFITETLYKNNVFEKLIQTF